MTDGDLEDVEGPCASFVSTSLPYQTRQSCTCNVLSPLSQELYYGLVAAWDERMPVSCSMITEDEVWEAVQRLRKAAHTAAS
jgi:hypothetical protein